MKKLLVLLILLSGCGYASRNNELIGQVKKVKHHTPLICPDYTDADISLGVMRNGVGSMSSEDVWIYIPTQELANKLTHAAETGELVKVNYDVKRLALCLPEAQMTQVEVVK